MKHCNIILHYWIVCAARSISEEFSSGDTRYRDNEESAHGKERKDKEDRDEGNNIV